MTDNPLKARIAEAKTSGGRVTPDILHELATSLNAEHWVQHSGRHYGAGIDKDGKHFLDCRFVRP